MSTPEESSESGWFCVRTKPKAEHIAGRHLQRYALLDEVFCPRIRYEKPTARGKVWFTEALFPGYLFARFCLRDSLRAVNATPSVSGVLRFAEDYPTIDPAFLEQLRAEFPEEEDCVRVIAPDIAPGDEVVVGEGALAGLRTVVTRVLPGAERIRILMEWLGEEREVEVSRRAVSRPGAIRSALGN